MRGEDSARRASLSWLSEDTLDTEGYQDILQNSLLPAAQGWLKTRSKREFQQDKASCHTAKSTKRWLEQHGVGGGGRLAHQR